MADQFQLDEDEIAFLLDASEANFDQLVKRIAFVQTFCPDRIELTKVLKLMIKKRSGEASTPPTNPPKQEPSR